MKSKKLVVYIIPTYNEYQNIPFVINAVVDALRKTRYPFKILFIDDNSPDNTGRLIKGFQKKDKRILLITGKRNGLGNAMIRGYKYAIDKLKADIVIANEADMSYNPKLVLKMIEAIEEGQDAVIAVRKIKSSGLWSWDRKLIHWFSNNFVSSVIAGESRYRDRNCAFRAIKVRGILDKVDFQSFPKGFSFFNYLLFKLSQVTPRIKEIEAVYTPRKFGESKISFKPKYIKTLLKDSFEYLGVCFRIRLEKIFK